MNILIVALDFKPKTGGVAEHTHQIAYHLGLGRDRILVLTENIEEKNKYDINFPYQVTRFSHDALSRPSFIRHLTLFNIVKNNVRRHSIDAIIANEFGALIHINWLIARCFHIPLIIFSYGRDIKIDTTWYERCFKRFLLQRADKIFCISSFTQKEVTSFGVPVHRTAVIHPGISDTFLRDVSENSGNKVKQRFGLVNKAVVLTLGRIIERKGIDKTIEAVSVLRSRFPNIVYVIAGDGPYRPILEGLVSKLHLRENVIFTGFVSEDEKHSFYAAADLFVMPNRELADGDIEGFGIGFLEANACGKPVIGGKSGGAPDAIRHGRTGLLVNPTDVDELAESIALLLENREYAKQLGLQGKQRVIDGFSWGGRVARLRRELEGLCNRDCVK